MSILSTLSTDNSIKVASDTLGAGGPLESGIYNATVSVAYVTKASSGALGLVLHLKTDTGREHRETLWVTSGTAKGCKNYYEKDGEKRYLPDFEMANNLALLTVGQEISELGTEEKVVNVWSPEAKAEVPTKVDMITDLLGQEIIAGIIKQKVDKTVRTDDGVYVPSGETREEAVLDKLFRARDRKTVAEIRAQAEEASFIDRWEQKWTGQVRDRSKGVAAAGTAGVPKAAQAAAKKPTQSLFS